MKRESKMLLQLILLEIELKANTGLLCGCKTDDDSLKQGYKMGLEMAYSVVSRILKTWQ